MAHDARNDGHGSRHGENNGTKNGDIESSEREREKAEKLCFLTEQWRPLLLPFLFYESVDPFRSRNETRRMRFGWPNSWVRVCGTRELRGGIGPGGSGAKNGARIRTVTIAKCQVFVVSWL